MSTRSGQKERSNAVRVVYKTGCFLFCAAILAGCGKEQPTLTDGANNLTLFAVDTSGSIGEAELAAFAAEIGAILGEYQTTITLLYCDSKVQGQAELTREDLPLRLEAPGGGGTDFRPVFRALDESGESPAALVYLTDLYGPFPEVEPNFPVLWVATTDRQAPFGETVKLGIDR